MTQPTPPSTVGTQPQTAAEVNAATGAHLRSFLAVKNVIDQDRDFLSATTLTGTPWFFTADQETLIKTAILGLATALDSVDMTFIDRMIGLG